MLIIKKYSVKKKKGRDVLKSHLKFKLRVFLKKIMF